MLKEGKMAYGFIEHKWYCPECEKETDKEDFTPIGICNQCAEKEKREEEGSGGFRTL